MWYGRSEFKHERCEVHSNNYCHCHCECQHANYHSDAKCKTEKTVVDPKLKSELEKRFHEVNGMG